MTDSLSPRLRRALIRAALCHDGHYRKASHTPYLTHLVAVMSILQRHGASEDLLVAALLHDVLEDRPDTYSRQEMTAEFGEHVTFLVTAVTKDGSLPTWQARAEDYLARLCATGDAEATLLCVADKLHNALSIIDDYEDIGVAVWERFNAGRENQLWWYGVVATLGQDMLGDHPLVAEYIQVVKRLEHLAE